MAFILHGLSSCDTVKKARAWLAGRGIACVFHDYKVEGVDPARLDRWIEVVGWEALLNRAGTTYRKLDAAEKTDLDRRRAAALMVARPSLIKRPVLEHPGGLLVGFKPEAWAAALG